ncbi:hypothetical protein evm_006737 [Chilo suppressalis]|nr:hypothetical protein evm_006737 [Chilo suppressalis]
MRSGAGVDEIFNPIWFAFDIMERFLGPAFTVDDTVNTEEELFQNVTTPPTQGSDPKPSETMPSKPPQTKERESSQTVHNSANNSKTN